MSTHTARNGRKSHNRYFALDFNFWQKNMRLFPSNRKAILRHSRPMLLWTASTAPIFIHEESNVAELSVNMSTPGDEKGSDYVLCLIKCPITIFSFMQTAVLLCFQDTLVMKIGTHNHIMEHGCSISKGYIKVCPPCKLFQTFTAYWKPNPANILQFRMVPSASNALLSSQHTWMLRWTSEVELETTVPDAERKIQSRKRD